MTSQKYRIIFMGSPAFSVPALEALAAAHEVVAVYCQPAKPAGRGLSLQACPVQQAAERLGIPVYSPKSFRKDAQALETFQSLNADLAVVAAYGLILPQAVLDAPKRGCVNIHASLLPRWRGAAPLQRAIESGDTETGVAIMQMEAGLDTGPVWRMASMPITHETTLPQLHDAMSALGASELMAALPDIMSGEKQPTPQPEDGTTYAAKITREEGAINWAEDAATIERRLRAFTPWPGLYFMHKNTRVKLLEAKLADGSGAAGILIGKDGTVACGNGALQLLRVQPEGKAKQSFTDFINGARLSVGDSL